MNGSLYSPCTSAEEELDWPLLGGTSLPLEDMMGSVTCRQRRYTAPGPIRGPWWLA